MSVLFKKLFRDLWKNRGEFISIFLMIFLGLFSFAGVHSYMDGMKYTGDKYYKEYNFQHIWVNGENITKNDISEIKNMNGVKDVRRLLKIQTNLEEDSNITLETNFISDNEISKMFVVEGEEFSKDKKGFWLDSYLAKNLNKKVGDELILNFKNYKIKGKILGLVNTPDHIYFLKDKTEIFQEHKNYGFVYTSWNLFPEESILDTLEEKILQNPVTKDLADKMKFKTKEGFVKYFIKDYSPEKYYIYNEAHVLLDDEGKVSEVKKEIEGKIKNAKVVTTRNEQLSYSKYKSEIEEGETYSVVFTFMLLFIALIAVVTTMNRYVKKERVQIGTLKALGIKKYKIFLHYLSYIFIVSIVAGALGIFIGNVFIGEKLASLQKEYLETPLLKTKIFPIVYHLYIFIILLSTFVTYLSVRKILKEKPSDAIRVMAPDVKPLKTDITRLGIFKKVSFASKWNLRDMVRNKTRTLLGTVGIVGATMLLVCAFGMVDTLNSYIDWQFNIINKYETSLSLEKEISRERANEIIKKYEGESSLDLVIEFEKKGEKKASVIHVLDTKKMHVLTSHTKKAMKLNDDGIYVTEIFAKLNNLKKGDMLKWHVLGDDKWIESKIIGLNREPQNQIISCTKKYLESINKEYIPDTIYSNMKINKNEKIEGVEVIRPIQEVKNVVEDMIVIVRKMTLFLIIASALLGFTIVYNLGVLSFGEKFYQFATLKVLGFKNSKIKKIFIQQNIWITIFSCIIGLPLGYYLTDLIFLKAKGEAYDFNAYIAPQTYVYAVIGTIIVSVIVNLCLAAKIKKVDMVSSLKANE